MSHRRLLMVVYQFPPYGSVGGSIRATKFAKYLPEFGWEPSVVTIRVSDNDYIRKDSESLLSEVSSTLAVRRIPAVNPPRFLTRLLRGSDRSAARTSVPARRSAFKSAARSFARWFQRFAERHLLTYDLLIAWVPIALWHVWQELRQERYDAVFVTMPPRSMVLVAWLAKRLFRIPVLLDVRDDWVDTPPFRQKSRLQQAIGRWVERNTVRDVDRVVVVSSVSEADFRRRYPSRVGAIRMIPNGCDLAELDAVSSLSRESAPERFRVVHAGVVMPPGRDPRPFFEALALLRETNRDVYSVLDVLFIGSLPEESLRALDELNLRDVVRVTKYLPRNEFWATMRDTDILLTIGDAAFPSMVPGKIYDYWAARRPQLFVGPEGSAWSLIAGNRLGWCVNGSPAEIAKRLCSIEAIWRVGDLTDVSLEGIQAYDRRELARRLETELDAIVAKCVAR